MPLLRVDPNGIWCEAGGFWIDPWDPLSGGHPVSKALITHGHSDHARFGSEAYLCSTGSEPILRARIGADSFIETLTYGESLRIGDVSVSFHPAGHVLGSAQIR